MSSLSTFPAKLCVVLALLCLPLFRVTAQDTFVIVNIGFKFGYAITNQSSFVSGLELSVNYYRDLKGIGILVSTEQWTSGRRLYHYAIQGFYGLVGASFGPTILKSQSGQTIGYSGTLFGGAILLPYYRFTNFQNDTSAHELGVYAKLPLPVVYPKGSLTGG